MKIVKDERLMIEGLKHIRLVFILQNIVILAIVFYRYVLQGAGYENVSDLLMVFMGGIVAINFLNLKHSVEAYEHTGGVSRSYFMKLLYCYWTVSYLYYCNTGYFDKRNQYNSTYYVCLFFRS